MQVENEMGVIVMFSKICERKGWRIDSIQSEFPDAMITNIETGKQIKAEFEYKASNFKAHGHDPRECDLIICWTNDWLDCPMTIWELRNYEDCNFDVVKMNQSAAYILYLELSLSSLRQEINILNDKLAKSAHQGGCSFCTPGKKLSPTHQKIYDYFLENPNATAKQVSDEVGCAQVTVSRLIKKIAIESITC